MSAPADTRHGVNAIQLLRDALSRVIAISEALELGDPDYARALAGDLECDLAAGLADIGAP